MKTSLFYIIILSCIFFTKKSYSQFQVGPCDGRVMLDSAEILFDGEVKKMLVHGNRMYVLGGFYTVGKFTGCFNEINKADGEFKRASRLPSIPAMNNGRATAIPDGNGGLYIFGSFSLVGNSQRRNLARVDASGRLTSFSADVNGTINACVLYNGILYIGGYFTKVNNITRNYLAAVNANTGALTSWDPNVIPPKFLPCRVDCMLEDNGLMYVGGTFDGIGSTNRRNIAAIQTTTGNATGWAPEACFRTAPDYGGVLRMLKVNNLLYLCGQFDSVGGKVRPEVAALDMATGIATNWDPKPSSVVFSLAAKGDTVYLGGAFYEISGQPRYSFAAYSISTGNLLPVTANTKVKVVDQVHGIALFGDTMFIGGIFDTISGQPRRHIASLNRSTGALLSWKSYFSYEDLSLDVKTVNNFYNRLYVGGKFSSIGRKYRKGIACLDLDVDTINGWYPKVDSTISNVFTSANNNIVHISGNFSKVNDSARRYNATVDNVTGKVLPWNPIADGMFYDMEEHNGDLYIAGAFKNINGLPRYGLAKLNRSGIVSPWIGINSPGTLLAPSLVTGIRKVDGLLYVGGTFSDLGGQPRKNLGSIDLATGSATSWNPVSGQISFLRRTDTVLFTGNDIILIKQPTPKVINVSTNTPTRVDNAYGTLYEVGRFLVPVTPNWSDVYLLKKVDYRVNFIYYFDTTYFNNNGSYLKSIDAAELNTVALYGNKLYVGGIKLRNDTIGTQNALQFYLPDIMVHDASISTDSNSICAGQQTTLQAKSRVTYGATYQWKVNGLNINNPHSYYTFTPSDKDIVNCVISTAANNCNPPWQEATNSITYNVMPVITPGITISGPANEEAGKSVVIKAIIKDADTGYIIEWFNRGVSMGKTRIDSISYTKGTGKDSIYAVITPRTDTCYITDTSSLIIVEEKDETGIRSANGGDGRVMIYPNPFDTYVKIKGVEQDDVLLLYDVMGRKISFVTITTTDTEYLLSTSILRTGVYTLKLIDKKGISRKTMLIQKQ